MSSNSISLSSSLISRAIVAEYLQWFISFYQQPLWNLCSAFIFCRNITTDPRKNNKGSEEPWCMCVHVLWQCLGAEEGRGRDEGAGWAAGGEQASLLGWVSKARWGLWRAEGEDDTWLVCLLVWACGKVSLFTFVCPSAALFWATGMSCKWRTLLSVLPKHFATLKCSRILHILSSQDTLNSSCHVLQSPIPVIKSTVLTTCIYMHFSNESVMVCVMYATQKLSQTNVRRLFFYLNLP